MENVKLFEKNMKFLYSHLPHYYNLVASIKSRRFLIKSNNILDTKLNQFVYPNSIYEDSEKLAFYPTHNKLWQKDFAFIKPKKWDENKFYITGKIINEMINKYEKLNHTNGFYFDKNFLPTTIIYGLLSGYHLEILARNFEFQSLLVYEPNEEFFAISLYFVDYEKLYKKLGERFFIQVGGKLDERMVEKFLYERVITSTFLQLSLTTYNHPLIEDAKNSFLNLSLAKLRGWGTYEDEIIGIKNHFENINRYKLLRKKVNLNIPVCVVGSGKSLEKSFKFLKENQDSMIIISVGTALKPLMSEGIKSDFHIEQERIEILIDALKDVLPKYNGYFIGASVVNPKIFKMAKNPLMYIRSGFTFEKFYDTPLKLTSPLVGNAGVAIASMFTKEIYLVGMDLGFRIGERVHSKNSFYDKKKDIQKSALKVQGNFSEDIYTNSLFLTSKENIEKLIQKENLKVYNLSDGAFIKGSIPLEYKKLPKINKKETIDKILSLFEDTNFQTPDVNPHKLLLAISKALEKTPKNYKELTGLIDFLEDLIKGYALKDEAGYNLVKGSLWHILFNLYVLSHKISLKDFNKLAKIIKKEIFKLNFEY